MTTVRYVTITAFCRATGYTRKAIYHKIYDGVWAEGIHYRRAPDGHYVIDIEAYHRWVEGEKGQALTLRTAACA
jgi:hypothetical protein